MHDESSRTITRIFAVLDQLSVSPRPLSNAELASALDVPISSMHRLLRKLVSMEYLELDQQTRGYTVAVRLSELSARLAEGSGYSAPMRSLMSSVRAQLDANVSLWVASGVQVRLIAMLAGKVRGLSSHAPGEIREPFSTPGLAIAAVQPPDYARQLIHGARRRSVPLGRGYRSVREVTDAITQVARRGYAVGSNLRSDGWAMLAWPVVVSEGPMRQGALAIGLPVQDLRRKQDEIVAAMTKMLAQYQPQKSRKFSPALGA